MQWIQIKNILTSIGRRRNKRLSHKRWRGGRVPEVSSRCKQVYRGSSVWKQVGISIYIWKVTTESEVADTGGSTATGAPL